MNDIQLTENQDTKGGGKIKSLLNKKILKNNKGFSLVELLIVIAIMGVLAVIAFNMFGGVLGNSKMRADDQQGENIAKALLTYCVDSNDWDLNTGTCSGSAIGSSSTTLINSLMQTIDCNSKQYGPYLSRKDPSQGVSATVNQEAYLPQYRVGKGGTYQGWDIDVYKGQQNVKCVPTITSGGALTINN